jgi:hypothetical protein
MKRRAALRIDVFLEILQDIRAEIALIDIAVARARLIDLPGNACFLQALWIGGPRQ